MNELLNRISYPILIFLAALLGAAPFHSTPHLVEKLQMLFAGELSRFIDVFDLLMHASPVFVLVLKILHDTLLARK